MKSRILLSVMVVVGTYAAGAIAQQPVGTAFTYQGKLEKDGGALSDTADFELTLWDDPNNGTQIGALVSVSNVDVVAGVFSIMVDFGLDAFDQDARWLQIAVRSPAGSGSYTTLTPRQKITPTPFSIATRGVSVDASGNVGLGQTDPLAALHVQSGSDLGIGSGDVFSSEDIVIENARAWLGLHSETQLAQNAQSGVLFTKHELGDPGTHDTWSIYRGIGASPGDLHFTYGTASDPATNSEIMQLTPTGDVGIGTYLPKGRLHVSENADPNVVLENSGSTGTYRRVSLNFKHSNGVGAEIEARRESLTAAGMSLAFSTQSSGGALNERMRVTPAGDVGVGTSDPYTRLHVKRNPVSTFDPNDLTEEDVVIEDNNDAWLGLYSGEGGTVGSGIVLAQRYAGGPGLLHNKWAIYRETQSSGNSLLFKFTNGTSDPADGDAALELTDNDTARVKVLEILGADLAERFPVTESVEPGKVVEIDPENAGQLRLSRGAYSHRVAGVISGAGDLPAGAILGTMPGMEDAPPVALSGRVWTLCDASSDPIEPGDLLTTSDVPGHAMKVQDHGRAQGAIIGKAMTRLEQGETGLVLVLVSLQ